MSEPLPPPSAERVPAGARPWRTDDVNRWITAGPAAWAHPLWSCLALVATGVWAIMATPDPLCTPADPCGPDWWGMFLACSALLGVYWVWRRPTLALILVAPVTILQLTSPAALATAPGPARLGVTAAVVFTALALWERLAARGRQREVIERAAGPERHPLPASAVMFPRGRTTLVVAGTLLAVTGLCLWQGLAAETRENARDARAQRLTVEVVDRGEDSVTVRLPDGDIRVVDAFFPASHEPGRSTAVFVDGDGDRVRLVAEPYDAFGWQMLMLLFGLPGVALLVNGLAARSRWRRMTEGTVPVLRVRADNPGPRVRTRVFAADDPRGRRPALSLMTVPPTARDLPGVDDDPDGGEPPGFREVAERATGQAMKGSHVVEAVLYGAVTEGAEAVLVTGPDGVRDGLVECGVTPVRARALLPDARNPDARPYGPHGSGRALKRRRRDLLARGAGEEMAERAVGEPLVALPSLFRRMVAFSLVALGGHIAGVTLSEVVQWRSVVPLFGVLSLFFFASSALWRVTVERRGLWVTRLWSTSLIPWEDIRMVRHWDADTLRVVDSKGRELLLPVGGAVEERVLRRVAGVRERTRAVEAMWRRPELRPVREADVGWRGMPMGPVVVLLGVVVGVVGAMWW
ncbi:hypothetical protein [Streptomyces sp. ST2-7A]|uniref:hypothetical protein n=1 Tax=Streptomyces sp. ST2-7A TaxID=2907214 RepID=UPI001F383240|nr:hypothetical protein [Streptomyces sp. ST2-7A]MCE7078964.1 hypothetical protein [Streptomyces sp. ST2-7A]